MDNLIWVFGILLIGALMALGWPWVLIGLRLTGLIIPRKPYEDHLNLIQSHIQILYPQGEGPFPAVLLFHGCGGVRQISHNYAQLAVQSGCVAIIVDSLTPRGIDYEIALEQVCKGKQLWGRERASDVYVAMDIARNDPKINAANFALAGWSHGGWAILDGLALAGMKARPDGLKSVPDEPFSGVSGMFLVYPYASLPAVAKSNPIAAPAPMDVILVENDTHASEGDMIKILDREEASGRLIKRYRLCGVTHGFDEPDHHPTSSLRYDDQEAQRNEGRFVDFLRERLGCHQL